MYESLLIRRHIPSSSHCSEKPPAFSPSVKETRLDIISQKDCKEMTGFMDFREDSEMCAAKKNNESYPFVTYQASV